MYRTEKCRAKVEASPLLVSSYSVVSHYAGYWGRTVIDDHTQLQILHAKIVNCLAGKICPMVR